MRLWPTKMQHVNERKLSFLEIRQIKQTKQIDQLNEI